MVITDKENDIMKRIIYIIGICAACIAVSCTKEDNLHVYGGDNGVRLKFAGESYDAMTKVSIGEKDGDKYPLLWQAGDVISVWSEGLTAADMPSTDAEGNPVPGTAGMIIGEQAELFAESAGKPKGIFQSVNTITVPAAAPVIITYPGTAKFVDGTVTSDVAAVQVQRSSNSSLHVGNNALAYAKATLSTETTDAVAFTLKQQTAFVKLSLTTSEYSGYKLKGAKLLAADEQLSGTMAVKVADDSFTVTGSKDYVGAQFRTPVPFTGTQDIYFATLPVDLTGKKVIVSVEMTDDAGVKTVTVPVPVNGGKLSASCLTVLSVNVSASSLSDYKWYEPVETRDLVNGWAYGPQNTYFVEQKADAPTTVTIDVKARGDFSKVVEPKYYGLYLGSSEMSGRKLCYINDEANYTYESGLFPVKSDYTIDVSLFNQSVGNGRWTVVAIYDKDEKVIWSYMICKYLEGDPVTSVTYPNGVSMMDRNLGATYSNALSEKNGTFDNGGAFFQWGRKDPTMWSNSANSTHNPALNQRYLQRVAVETDDIAFSIANPGITVSYDGSNNISQGDWKCDEHSDALWGGNVETGIGHKTIYDPCPAGYRTPDPSVLEFVHKNALRWEIPNNHKSQTEETIKADSPFKDKFSVLAVSLGDSKYDYWPYAGARWADGGNWGNRPSSNNKHAALYWSNCEVPSSQQTYALQYCYFSAAFDGSFKGANKSRAFVVRCQVDTENR